MKRLLQTGTREEYLDIVFLFLRIAIAALMIRHGLPKLSKLMAGGEIKFGNPIGLGPTVTLILAVFSEVICSVLIGIGLGTRLASIPLIITMFVAAFISHGPDPFGRKEMAILYMLFYIALLVIGSRKYSIDYLLTTKNR